MTKDGGSNLVGSVRSSPTRDAPSKIIINTYSVKCSYINVHMYMHVPTYGTYTCSIQHMYMYMHDIYTFYLQGQ